MPLRFRQDEPDWEPGDRPVNSVVNPPPHAVHMKSTFNRSEFELFATHTTSAEHTEDAHRDRLLEWASHPKFRPDRIRYVKMRTMGKKAIKLNIPAGVLQKDFSEPADGAQHMVFNQSSSFCEAPDLRAGSILSSRRCSLSDTSASMGPSTTVRCTRSARGMPAETFCPCPFFKQRCNCHLQAHGSSPHHL